MKRLLMLAAVAATAYRFGRHAANRNSSRAAGAQNAARASVLPMDADLDAALADVARFDVQQVALAELALERGVTGATRDFATMLRDEHGSHPRSSHLLEIGESAIVAGDACPPAADATIPRLESLASEQFEAEWIAAVTDGHDRMLERLDETLSRYPPDSRITDRLRAVRDTVQMHLHTALTLVPDRGTANPGAAP